MYILAIESSCDETSISLMNNGIVIKNIISSQIDTHKNFGGVIPEIASRLHVENFPFVILDALKDIDTSLISHVAYTKEPGLIGCLQIG
jgi:N6-L-threonylcarbamoyladenine synthase